MGYQVGDIRFSRIGEPLLVTGRDPSNGTVTVKGGGEKLKKTQQYGYINGLKKEDRRDFQVILDDVRSEQLPIEQVEKLRGAIGKLGQDPNKYALKRYLEGELVHIVNSNNLQLDSYTTTEDQL